MRRIGGKGRGERRVWKKEGKMRGLGRRKGRNKKEGLRMKRKEQGLRGRKKGKE